MEAVEYAYLMFEAGVVRKYAAEAEARGEAFHASEAFHPLACGARALARIEGGELRLRVRASSAALAAECARRFFPGPHATSAQGDEYAFVGPVPEGPFTP